MTSGLPNEPGSAAGAELSPSSPADTGSASQDDAEELKAKIEQTREQLGQAAEQLAAKTDVKARAQAKMTDLTQCAKDTTGQFRRQAAVRADGARSHLADKSASVRRSAASVGDAGQAQLPDSVKQAVTRGIAGARNIARYWARYQSENILPARRLSIEAAIQL
jgi:Protein of unknown function (DUF3618)